MSDPRFLLRAAVSSIALIAVSCSHADPNSEWRCAPSVDVTGVWEVTRVGQSGSGIACLDVDSVWTLLQSGCEVTIVAGENDSANGARGSIDGNRVYVEWTWSDACYRYQESIDATVAGDDMSGTYYMVRTRAVYPSDCPGTGLCTSVLQATRRPL